MTELLGYKNILTRFEENHPNLTNEGNQTPTAVIFRALKNFIASQNNELRQDAILSVNSVVSDLRILSGYHKELWKNGINEAVFRFEAGEFREDGRDRFAVVFHGQGRGIYGISYPAPMSIWTTDMSGLPGENAVPSGILPIGQESLTDIAIAILSRNISD